MNVVNLIGRVTKDPEVRYTNNQTAVCSATLAVDRPVREGQEKQADFIRIILFSKGAETFGKYITKGRQVAVEGRIQTGSYQKDNGETVYTTDVVVNRFHFVGSKNDNQGNTPTAHTNTSQRATQSFVAPEGFDAIDNDIPF